MLPFEELGPKKLTNELKGLPYVLLCDTAENNHARFQNPKHTHSLWQQQFIVNKHLFPFSTQSMIYFFMC